MKIQLNWQPKTNRFYGQIFEAKIFYGFYLFLYDNGEGWYNVELHDCHGNEKDAIGGGESVEEAKLEAEQWLVQQCKHFLKEWLKPKNTSQN